MWQEIITYIIIGVAVVIAVRKTIKNIGYKKAKAKDYDSNATVQTEHNCSDCIADCMLRDTIKTSVSSKSDRLCKKIEVKSK